MQLAVGFRARISACRYYALIGPGQTTGWAGGSESGNYCKHEAAVLYAIEEEFPDYEMASSGESLESLDSVISSMSEEELRSFVREAAEKWKIARDHLYSLYSDFLPEGYCDEIIGEAGALVSEIEDQLEYGEYYDDWNRYNGDGVDGCVDKLQAIAEEKFEPLFSEKNLFETAFSLSLEIIRMIPLEMLDDYGYDTDELLQPYLSVLSGSYIPASDDGRKRMEDMALAVYDKGLSKHLEPAIRSFLIEIAGNTGIAERSLRTAVKRLEENPDDADAASDILVSMKVLGSTAEEIEKFYSSHSYSWAFVSVYSDFFRNAGRLKKAADLILAYRNEYHENEESVSDKLLSIYREERDSGKLADELIYRIFTIEHFSLEHIHELKGIGDESDWSELYERIVESGYKSAKFFFEEKDYQRLMDYCEINRYQMNHEYAKKLSEIYPERVMAILEKRLSSLAYRMNDRKGYHEYVRELNMIGDCNGGPDLQKKQVQQVLADYPNRPALKDELRKAGFCI